MTEAAARAWLAEDPDPETRAELAALLDAGDNAALADRFGGHLEFGTAGLRGELGAGPARMNRVVVIRAAAGLVRWLANRDVPGPVVIGYDARRNSDVFARDTAAVVTGGGRRALLLPRPLPTPVLAAAIRPLRAAAGVMVTASHNPARDNGYKVYLADGAQLVPPADREIAAEIERVGRLGSVPRGGGGRVIGDDVVEGYVDAVARLAPTPERDLRIAYTPLHGVGGDVAVAVLTRAGFAPPAVVAAQARPDPAFPTVGFPNPEEPGAMDRLLALAAESAADVAIANDPDADRLAVAVPDGDRWRILRGDEVGALLGDFVLGTATGADRLVATTIVSSSLLGRLAAAHGVHYAETLTGFKWIARAADDVPGARLVFGYEEALGYAVDPAVRDKDGISAAVLLCALAAHEKARGATLPQRLDALAREHGLHATASFSVRAARVADVAPVVARLAARPPTELAGRVVESAEDLSAGVAGLPPAAGVRWRLAGDARVVVRPSGTEPKVKAYLEVVRPVVAGDVAATRHRAAADLAALRDGVGALLRSN